MLKRIRLQTEQSNPLWRRRTTSTALLAKYTFAASALFLCLSLSDRKCALGADPNAAEDGRKKADIVARVDGILIFRAEIDHVLSKIAPPRDDAAGKRLAAAATEQIVRRRLALLRLEAIGKAATPYAIDRAAAEKEARLARTGKMLDDVLKQQGIDRTVFHRDLAWELSWSAYRRSEVTHDHLIHFFDANRREFDGTEVRARHILFARRAAESEPGRKPAQNVGLAARAQSVRERLVAKTISFAEAARQFSDAPSRDTGGDLGFFPRHGVMHERIAAAAFALKPGEISEPVDSPFGIHLIEVVDEKPGRLTMSDIGPPLRRAAEKALFDRLVAEQRPNSLVERFAP